MAQELIELWDYMVEQRIATDDELRLVTSIDGMNIDTLNDVLYVRTGYRDIKQYKGDL